MSQSKQFEMVNNFNSLLKALFELYGLSLNDHTLKSETRYYEKGVWMQIEFCWPATKEAIVVMEAILFTKIKGQIMIRPPLNLQGVFYEWDNSKEDHRTALEAIVEAVINA